MKFIGTKYEVTLKGADGAEFSKVRMIWDGVYKLGKLMWATYYPWNDTCVLYFADKYHDSELYDAGYYKVTKIVKVDTYEERTDCGILE